MLRRALMLAACGAAALAVAGCGAHGQSGAVSTDAAITLPAGGPDPPAPIVLTHGWERRAAGSRRWVAVKLPNDFNPGVTRWSATGRAFYYRLRFTGPPAEFNRTWQLHFDEVRRVSTVWLNGHQVGSNWDPYAPFDVPAAGLRPGATNTLVVRVDNFEPAGSFPEDWWDWGGIVQPVVLEPLGRVVVDDLGVTPELGCSYRCGSVFVRGVLADLAGTPLQPEVTVSVTPPGSTHSSTFVYHARPLDAGATKAMNFRVPVPSPVALWGPGHPALYQVTVRVNVGGRVEQVKTLSVGMRSVSVRGGVLYLNGQRLWLRGAAIHEDMKGHGAALTQADIDRIVSELRAVGANVTRTHYLLSQAMLDALDRAGIMVWEEPPVDHADVALSKNFTRGHALQMLRATLLGDRSHPSVIVNSVANELTSTPDAFPGTLTYLRQAIPLVRRLDPAALVGLDIYPYPGYPAQPVYDKLDVLGLNDYYGWYPGPRGHSTARFAGLGPYLSQTHAQYPGLALTISEFGVEARFSGPASEKGTYAFQSDYLRRTFAVLDQLPFMNGAIYWTLREFAVMPNWSGGLKLPQGVAADGVHRKGLISYAGWRKPAFDVARRLFADPPPYVR